MIDFILNSLEPKILLIGFFVPALYRILSGAQNGLCYADNKKSAYFVTLMMSVVAILYMMLFAGVTTLNMIFAFLTSITSFGVMYAFQKKKLIHFFEYLTTSIFLIFVSIQSPIGAILSVYPSLIIHKGLINLGGGKPFLDEATNDPTGRTVSILGIDVPRLSNTIRISIALLSIIVFIILYNY